MKYFKDTRDLNTVRMSAPALPTPTAEIEEEPAEILGTVYDYRSVDGVRDLGQLRKSNRHFKQFGYKIVHALSKKQLSAARTLYEEEILTHTGAVHADIHGGDVEKREESLRRLGGSRKGSKVAGMFYAKVIIGVYLSKIIKYIFDNLIADTFGKNEGHFKHPFGPLGPDSVPYMDRVGYRVASWVPPVTDYFGKSIGPEIGLGLHVDQNPFNPYLVDSEGKMNILKWRPVQSFITLSDHTMVENGGICLVPGFHKYAEEFWEACDKSVKMETSAEHSGEFHRMNHCGGLECIPILVPAGCIVLWDSRLPHMTTKKCENPTGRQMLFGAWLPDVKLNRDYGEQLRVNFNNGKPPPHADQDTPCYMPADLVLNEFQKTYLEM